MISKLAIFPARTSLSAVGCLLFLILIPVSSVTVAAVAVDKKTEMLSRADDLLDQVEATVLNELEEQARILESENRQLVQAATGNAEIEAQINAEDFAVRQRAVNLSRRIEGWATSGEALLATVTSEELNDAMAEARAIARYYGLDVEKLGKLYELGKKTIKTNAFVIPDKLPPDEDESMPRYFQSFFVFAEERDRELSEYREQQQAYRLTLFKRVTLAYIRALLASSQSVPECRKTAADQQVVLDGRALHIFGCDDVVVEQLRAYIQAVQKIASADADAYAVQAEMVVAEQVLVADMAAGVPLVGDAIDFYQLMSGENLAGECLSRVEYGLTAVFTAIPFLPANWATQLVKRMGLEERLSSVVLMMAQAGEWSDEMVAGMASRFGVTPEMFKQAEEAMDALGILLDTQLVEVKGLPQGGEWGKRIARQFGVSEERIVQVSERLGRDVTLGGGVEIVTESGKISTSAARELNTALEEQALANARLVSDDAAEDLLGDIVYKNNHREAFDAQQLLKRMPKQVRERMREKSEALIARNLDEFPVNAQALAGDPAGVYEMSNMVPAHAAAYQELVEEIDRPIVVRSINPDTKKILPANFPTKPMNVKGKSADWGPQAAFIPVDQNFSKLANPGDAIDLDEVRKFYDKVQKCLARGQCEKTDLVLPSGDSVFIWDGPNGRQPIVKRRSDGQFIDHDTGAVLNPDAGAVTPMEVLAARDKNRNLVPLTADYDLLAVGSRDSVGAAGKWSDVEGRYKIDPELGYTTAVERDTLKQLEGVNKKTGYEGGKLVHHGPENQFVFSPGALAQDTYVTVFDPQRGPKIVPRCDYECMQKWCDTSGMCGAIRVCVEKRPSPACLMIDPDRLLKDYFSNLRLRGYSDIRPSSAWQWGDYNGLAGWSPKVVLKVPAGTLDEPGKWAFGQYKMTEGVKVVPAEGVLAGKVSNTTYRGVTATAMKATQYLFTCPGKQPAGG